VDAGSEPDPRGAKAEAGFLMIASSTPDGDPGGGGTAAGEVSMITIDSPAVGSTAGAVVETGGGVDTGSTGGGVGAGSTGVTEGSTGGVVTGSTGGAVVTGSTGSGVGAGSTGSGVGAVSTGSGVGAGSTGSGVGAGSAGTGPGSTVEVSAGTGAGSAEVESVDTTSGPEVSVTVVVPPWACVAYPKSQRTPMPIATTSHRVVPDALRQLGVPTVEPTSSR
jgi:hypothetical protein